MDNQASTGTLGGALVVEASRDPFHGLVAVYASHADAGVDAVGRLEGLVDEAYRRARGAKGVVVLATCNRFEVYLDRPGREVVDAIKGLYRERGVEPLAVEGREAARRILRIAAGLESRILGEHEILGQVRAAWLEARRRGASSPLLDLVFHQAVVAGKRVRRETGIGRGPAGYPSAAVHLASRLLHGLDGARVLVAGAGKAGAGMLRVLCSLYRPGLVVVASRDPERARGLLAHCPEARVTDREGARLLAPYDAALVAVTDPGGLGWVPGASRVVVDISNPPAVEGGNVYGLGDVEEVVRRVVEERRRWLPRAQEIVEEELGKLEARLLERTAASLIEAMMEYSRRLAAAEARRCRDPSVCLESYARKLLHPIIVSLRRGHRGAWTLEDFVRELEAMYRERLADS